MEAVLEIEIMKEPQSNLEEVNPSILKDDFSPRTVPSTFTSIELLWALLQVLKVHFYLYVEYYITI